MNLISSNLCKCSIMISAILISVSSLYAAQKYEINPSFKENTNYKVSSKMMMTMQTPNDQEVDGEAKNEINPMAAVGDMMAINMESSADVIMKFESMNSQGLIPLSMEVSDIKFDIPSIADDTAKDGINTDSIMREMLPSKMDYNPSTASFSSAEKGEEGEYMGLPFMQFLDLKQTLPSKSMQIGETVVVHQDIPMAMFAGNSKIASNYTLQSVRDGKAYFDVTFGIETAKPVEDDAKDEEDRGQEDMMAMIFGSIDFNFDIQGTGTAVYDLENDFFITNNSSAVLTMSMSFPAGDDADDESVAEDGEDSVEGFKMVMNMLNIVSTEIE